MAPEIRVEQGDAIRFDCDVLILKYAQARYGVDSNVAKALIESGHKQKTISPRIGDAALVASNGVVGAREVLFVGVEPLPGFGYREIRFFARQALGELSRAPRSVHTVAATLHGTGYGLDEQEAFESLVAGFIDSIEAGDFPPTLTTISIVERESRRAQRLAEVLDGLLPGGRARTSQDDSSASAVTRERLRSVGYESASKRHVFVAMPYTDEMSDHFHYGIQGAVRSAGYLCERADLAAFTGDILQRVKNRIASAALVVADLTGANPNVYLEVGYAWGQNIPTVLVVNATEQLKFDVQGQRCLTDTSIHDLEQQLSSELQQLTSGAQSR